MKKYILLMPVGLVLMLGCQKEVQNLPSVNSSNQNIETEDVFGYVLRMDGHHLFYERTNIALNTINTHKVPTSKKNKSSNYTFGNFSGYNGSATISFSGTENGGEIGGRAKFVQALPTGVADVILETECVSIEGNEAVYGGTLTVVIDNGGFPPGQGPFVVGNVLYFKVKDSDQAGDSYGDPIDQHSNTLFIYPSSNCGNLPPSSPSWGPMVDVENETDEINVNN